MKISAKIFSDLKQLSISAKSIVLDIWLGSESAAVQVDAKYHFNRFLITQRFNQG